MRPDPLTFQLDDEARTDIVKRAGSDPDLIRSETWRVQVSMCDALTGHATQGCDLARLLLRLLEGASGTTLARIKWQKDGDGISQVDQVRLAWVGAVNESAAEDLEEWQEDPAAWTKHNESWRTAGPEGPIGHPWGDHAAEDRIAQMSIYGLWKLHDDLEGHVKDLARECLSDLLDGQAFDISRALQDRFDELVKRVVSEAKKDIAVEKAEQANRIADEAGPFD